MSESPADIAVRLPWLAPSGAALAALARNDQATLDRYLHLDPGLAILWLHVGAPNLSESVGRAAMLKRALAQLSGPPIGRIDQSVSALNCVRLFAHRVALAADQHARSTATLNPTRAAVAGLLAPLAWWAIGAADANAVADCLNDPEFRRDPARAQIRHWGMPAGRLTRTLIRRWRLPTWFAAAVANLDLPAEIAADLGDGDDLAALVRQSLSAAALSGDPLAMGEAAERKPSPCNVTLTFDDFSAQRDDPYFQPYLGDLLAVALDRIQSENAEFIDQLEHDNETLRTSLAQWHASFAARLKTQKLVGLAEFAAGASHEINNPLAVISGQAQYLLVKDCDPENERALQVIIQQAKRIHSLLTDLMQFARPAEPIPRCFDVADAARGVATELHEFAALQRVRIELITPDDPCPAEADPKQVRTALTSLLRNAVEAAPEDGWVRITVEPNGSKVRVVVEDSGAGPVATHRDSMFDPFFSGRRAGRGRGLGLPTAWRLAREQGGDVAYDPRPDCPARFVLSLPSAEPAPARKSA